MNVLFVTTGLGIGGAERALCLLANNLCDNHKFNVTIYNLGAGNEFTAELSPGVHLISNDGKFWRLIQALIMVRNTPQLTIVGWMYHGNLIATMLKLIAPKKRLILNVRQTYSIGQTEKIRTKVIIRLVGLASHIATFTAFNCSKSVIDHIKLGYNSKNKKVIYNGFKVSKGLLKNSLNSKDVRIGHLARFHPMKNHLGFISAVVELMRFNPNVMVVMGGLNVDEENNQLLQNIPVEFRSQFRLLGVLETETIDKFFESIDFFCLSSKWGEGFPNVIGEAMASGVPCIANDVGEAKHAIGDTGWIADKETSLVKCLKKATSIDESSYRALSEKAQTRIRNQFSEKLFINSFREMLTLE